MLWRRESLARASLLSASRYIAVRSTCPLHNGERQSSDPRPAAFTRPMEQGGESAREGETPSSSRSSKKRLPAAAAYMGYSRRAFFKKVHNPRATKPWQNREAVATGEIHVEGQSDVLQSGGEAVNLGHLSTAGVLGMRSPHMSVDSAALGYQAGLEAPPAASMLDSDSSAGAHLESSPENDVVGSSLDSSSSLSSLYHPTAGTAQSVVPLNPTAAPAPLPRASVPIGNALTMNVMAAETYTDGPVPVALQSHLRRARPTALREEEHKEAHPPSRRELRDSIRLPRHINQLFHKIMGWSNDLEQLKLDGEPIDRDSEGGKALLKEKMASLTDRMKYGVLLADYEKDQFALKHQIAVAGRKMERQFLRWEGMRVLDQDEGEPAQFLRDHKAAVVMQSPASSSIPMVNRDVCSGCGALLQDSSPDSLGYVAPGEMERFVADRDRKAEARAEYADRMAELQRHWETHGRRVGEEWLDFMTEEEFHAFYRDERRPFVCHRCHALEHLGVTGRRKVWSAPDFTDRLTALREIKCVVLLVVDITDFPGSMVHNLPGLISMNNPVILAVNKMDCIRNRSFRYANKDRAVAASLVSERYCRRWVLDIATSFGLPRHQIKDVIPLSAKRGWNMEKLLQAIEDAANLNLRRPHKPLPTFVVGAANVGKSSLINALAHYLYVPQPPHPESKKVYYTRVDPQTGTESIHWRWFTPPNVNRAEMIDIPSRHDKKASKLMTVSSLPGTTVGVNAVKLQLTGGGSDGAFLYDTPGVLPHWHHTSPLTLLQMRRLLIRKFRHPQCFVLVPGNTLLLAGMAAIDVMKGCTAGMLFMVYTSQKAQHAIVQTELAEDFWRENLGKVVGPPDCLEQLEGEGDASGRFPLTESRSYFFECYARHRRRPVADVYVCGLGWVSFCVREAADVVLRVRTLPGVMHGVRRPLRYNDLRSFRFWPSIRRKFTHKGLDGSVEDPDKSIATVVQLVAGEHQTSRSEPGKDDALKTALPSVLAQASVKEVKKTPHVRHEPSSSSPLEELLQEIPSLGGEG